MSDYIKCSNCKQSKAKRLYEVQQITMHARGEDAECKYCNRGLNQGMFIEKEKGTCMKCRCDIWTGHKFGLCETCKKKNAAYDFDSGYEIGC